MSMVMDCSLTMAWCFSDEADAFADAVLDSLTETEGLVPSIWLLETANALLVAERSKRMTEAQTRRFVELLLALPIVVDQTEARHVMNNVLPVARRYALSSYDAAYLELAMRTGLPLATRDSRLARTARRCGVGLVQK
jgi:predicted nucleic acid-binding protein